MSKKNIFFEHHIVETYCTKTEILGIGDCAGHPPAGPFLKHTSKEQIANFCSVALPLRSRRPSRKKGFNHILLLPAGPSNARRPLHENG